MNFAHIHLLLNHFPTIGTIVGIGLFLIALIGRSDDLKRASLVVFLGIALVTIAAYVTGNMAQDKICVADTNAPCADTTLSKQSIYAHEGAALLAFAFMEITGGFAWLGLWQYRRISFVPRWTLAVVLLFAVVSFGLMARAANIGGEIRHPEIRAVEGETQAEPLAREVGAFVAGGARWAWPVCETLHFIGLSLLFGVASIVDLRMLGMMKAISFRALHRLLPWGILGFGINLITGMLFFVAAPVGPGGYASNATFQWKIALMLLAGINVLYFTVFDEPWEVKSGDDAPLTAKAVAASALVLVIGVIYCGRMLPFLGNAF
jgi:hypothetical protein